MQSGRGEQPRAVISIPWHAAQQDTPNSLGPKLRVSVIFSRSPRPVRRAIQDAQVDPAPQGYPTSCVVIREGHSSVPCWDALVLLHSARFFVGGIVTGCGTTAGPKTIALSRTKALRLTFLQRLSFPTVTIYRFKEKRLKGLKSIFVFLHQKSAPQTVRSGRA